MFAGAVHTRSLKLLKAKQILCQSILPILSNIFVILYNIRVVPCNFSDFVLNYKYNSETFALHEVNGCTVLSVSPSLSLYLSGSLCLLDTIRSCNFRILSHILNI